MRFITRGRVRKGLGLPIAILFTVAGLAFTASPGQAQGYPYDKYTDRWASPDDAGGIDTRAWLDRFGNGDTDYEVVFYANGEWLRIHVDDDMQSRGKVTAVIYDRSGRHVDTDTFTTDIGEWEWINLDIPGYTNNLPEGYDVYTKICVGLSDTCTPYVKGNA